MCPAEHPIASEGEDGARAEGGIIINDQHGCASSGRQPSPDAVGRLVVTLCNSEVSLGQQPALYHVYDNFCLPHASVRLSLPQPEPTNGNGSAKRWRPCTPAMAAGLTTHV
jgi:hypothetical protein